MKTFTHLGRTVPVECHGRRLLVVQGTTATVAYGPIMRDWDLDDWVAFCLLQKSADHAEEAINGLAPEAV